MLTQHRVWVYGDDVNTDVIFPGKYTYTLKTPEEIASKALEDLDPTFAPAARSGDVVVAGKNWGCGSSREQAVTALRYLGIPVIIAESFSRIYFRNCINQGILPIGNAELRDMLQTGDEIGIDLETREIHAVGRVFPIPVLSPSVQAILDAGGLVPMLQKRFNAPLKPVQEGSGG
jgi:3-isopropylmalate/(R)-2-methylmalate dehydratase small subunit